MKTEDIKTWEQRKKDAIEQCAYMDFSDSTFMSEEIDELRAALKERDAEIDENEALRDRMSSLLTEMANALKGPPAALSLHDWSDLPKVAATQRAVMQRAVMQQALAFVRWHCFGECRTEEYDGPLLTPAEIAKALKEALK